MRDVDSEAVARHVDEHREPHFRRLRRLIQQPSVSPTGEGIQEAAELLAGLYEEVGCPQAEVIPTEGNPVVYGEFPGAGPKTLLVYLMYDTQPYDDRDLWHYDPLGCEVDTLELPGGTVEALFSRGAMNSKGPLVLFLNALESILQTEGELPLTVKLLAEGEEELGSRHLPAFVKAHRDRLVADASFFPYLIQNGAGDAQMWLGCKGIVYVELECSGKRWGRGPEDFDIHGSYKAIVDSPAWRLVDALQTLATDNGNRVLVKELVEGPQPPSAEDRELIRTLAARWDPDDVKSMWHLSRFNAPEDDREALLTRYMFTSSLNVDGMWSGYTGPGSKTVLPHKATAKVDVRLVPGQDPDTVIPALRRHLDAHGYEDIAITPLMTGYHPSKTSLQEPANEALLACYRDFGYDPEIWPLIAGSAPFYWFTEYLKAPLASGGIGHGGRMHAPDEYIVYRGNEKLAGLPEATKFFARYLDAFAA